jgi:tripeptide aminopeptidase
MKYDNIYMHLIQYNPEEIVGIKRDRMIKEFLDIVKIDSPSFKERELIDYLARELSKMDLDFYEDRTGVEINGNAGNLIALKKGDPDLPVLLFMAHTDNVPPCKKVQPVIKGDEVFSDGTTVLGADNKAGIAVILEVLKIICEDDIKHGDIEIVFTVAEEVGLLGSKNLDYSNIKAGKAFVLDSSGRTGTYITKAPHHIEFVIKVTGKAAHAGVEPEKGISAIRIAAEAISLMPFGRIDEETTTNIGNINGGLAVNIVTENVVIKGEARSRNSEKLDNIIKDINNIFKETADKYFGNCEFEIVQEKRGYSIDEASQIAVMLRRAAEKCSVILEPRESGGSSDANILNQVGIETVNLGIGEKNSHTVYESVNINDMEKAVGLILEMIKDTRMEKTI